MIARFDALAIRLLRRQRLRSAASVLGIALGVAIIVSAMASGHAIRRQLDRSIGTVLGRADLVISADPYFTEREHISRLGRLPIAAHAARLSYRVNPLGQEKPLVLAGLRPSEARRIWDVNMVSGRFQLDRRHLVVTRSAAEQLGLEVGDLFTYTAGNKPRRLRVAGIISGPGLGEQILPTIFVDLSTAQREKRLSGKVSNIFIQAIEGSDIPRLKKDLARRLGPGMEIKETEAGGDYALAMGKALEKTLRSIGGLALALGLLLIYQATAATAARRLRFMALLKAQGAVRGQLLRLFFMETAVVGAGAAVLGLAIGLGVASGIYNLFGLLLVLPQSRYTLPASVFLVGPLLGFGAALVGAVNPIRRALGFSVADVLGGYGARGQVAKAPLPIAWLLAFFRRALGRIFPPLITVERQVGRDWSKFVLISVALVLGLSVVGGALAAATAFTDTYQKFFRMIEPGHFVLRQNPMIGLGQNVTLPIGLEAELKEIKGVSWVNPFYMGSAVYKGKPYVLRLDGRQAPGDWLYLEGDRRPAARRWRDGGWVALSSTFAKEQGLHPGDALTLSAGSRTTKVRVAAVIGDLRKGISGSWSDMNRRLGFSEVDEYSIHAEAGAAAAVEKRLRKFAKDRHYYLLDDREFMRQMDMMSGGFSAVMFSMAASMLLIVSIALSNIILLSAYDRMRLIGVMRAFGLTGAQLKKLLGFEGVFVALIGLPPGLLGGYFFGRLTIGFLGEQIGITLKMPSPWLSALETTIGALLLIYLMVTVGARRIVKTPTGEALRYY